MVFTRTMRKLTYILASKIVPFPFEKQTEMQLHNPLLIGQ